MRTKSRRYLLAALFIFLGFLAFLWYSGRTTLLYVVNVTEKIYCFHLDEEFKSIVPAETTIRLKVKTGGDVLFAVSEKIDGIMVEEFRANLGGKFIVYNIFSRQKDMKGKIIEGGKIIRINKDEPGKWTNKISRNNLHRIIMDKIPERLKSLRRFSPEDGIRLAGEVGDKDSLEWLESILRLPSQRVSWPEALRAIGMIGEKSSERLLLSYFNYEDADVKIAAVDGIYNLSLSTSVKTFIELYARTESNDYRVYMLKKLASLPRSFDLQSFIAKELGKLPHPNIMELLDVIENRKMSETAKELKSMLAKGKSRRYDRKTKKRIKEVLLSLNKNKRSKK